jgi:predicted ArsR family transcriptional regulator
VALSAAAPNDGLFRHWFTAKRVAKEAGVSIATARKHLDDLSICAGFERKQFPGAGFGYRHREEF